MAAGSVCKVPSCGKAVKGSGLCSGHLHRLHRYGSPTGRPPERVRNVCSVENCGAYAFGHGFCSKHYKRWRKHGDPNTAGTASGEVGRWLNNVALAHKGDECILTPFSRNPSGYGRTYYNGRLIGAHVYICTVVNGDRPSPKHEACHSCGNGHNGCVSPHHLRWGTRSDNVRDAIRHGTFRGGGPSGDDHPMAKLSSNDIRAIRQALDDGEPVKAIASRYGVYFGTIYSIKYRNTWSSVA